MKKLLDAGLDDVIMQRRDEFLKKDSRYKEATKQYTEAMEVYEHMDIPENIRQVVRDYIIAMAKMEKHSEIACYLAGAADANMVREYLYDRD